MKTSNIINKHLIILNEQSDFKIINKFVIDTNFKRIKYFIADNKQNKVYFKPNDIFNIGSDAVVIKKKENIVEEKDFNLCTTHYIIGTGDKIFTDYGDFVAVLGDIVFNEKYVITELTLINKQKDITKICGSGKNLIVIKDLTKVKPRKKKQNFPDKDELMKKIPVEMLIDRKTTDTKFLIGRMVIENITGITGEIIIKANTIITEKTINKAKSNYKLFELVRKSVEIK